jgi:3-methyladenine DNA glycosylase AlkD
MEKIKIAGEKNSLLASFKKEFNTLKNPAQAKVLSGFFKTGKGQYGEGDIFLGIKVPTQRETIKKYYDLDFKDLQELLNSKIHEYRLSALFILVKKFTAAVKVQDEKAQVKIYNFYLKNARNINNWDLVDLSAPNIVGQYLLAKNREILYDLVKSKNLWERRIAVLATFTFLRQKDFKDILKIAEILLRDEHDLIHKSVGWMLREAGKRDVKVLYKFLDKNYQKMPRTMLRYAIEKLPELERKKYLKK